MYLSPTYMYSLAEGTEAVAMSLRRLSWPNFIISRALDSVNGSFFASPATPSSIFFLFFFFRLVFFVIPP